MRVCSQSVTVPTREPRFLFGLVGKIRSYIEVYLQSLNSSPNDFPKLSKVPLTHHGGT